MAFLGKMKAKDREDALKLLKFIVEGTVGPTGMALVPPDKAALINKAEPGTLLISDVAPNAIGNVPVSATPQGIQAVNGGTTQSAATIFKLDDGFVLPPTGARGGGNRPETYPFAAMHVGQSFFVAATDARPSPAKTLVSTVNSANKRFATVFPDKKGKKPHPQAGQPTGKDGRKFAVRSRKQGDPLLGADGKVLYNETSNGARIWRIA